MNNNPMRVLLIVSFLIAFMVLVAGVILSYLWEQANAEPGYRRLHPEPEGYQWNGPALRSFDPADIGISKMDSNSLQ